MKHYRYHELGMNMFKFWQFFSSKVWYLGNTDRAHCNSFPRQSGICTAIPINNIKKYNYTTKKLLYIYSSIGNYRPCVQFAIFYFPFFLLVRYLENLCFVTRNMSEKCLNLIEVGKQFQEWHGGLWSPVNISDIHLRKNLFKIIFLTFEFWFLQSWAQYFWQCLCQSVNDSPEF